MTTGAIARRGTGPRPIVDKECVLQSARLVLRPPTIDDCESIVRWRNSPRVRAFWPQAEQLSVGEQCQYLEAYYRKDDDLYLMLVTKASGRTIGTIALFDVRPRRAQLGRLLIGEDEFLGQGLMKEAIERVLGHAFEHLLVEEVYLATFKENRAAFRLYLAAGFSVQSEQRVTFPRLGVEYTRVVMTRATIGGGGGSHRPDGT